MAKKHGVTVEESLAARVSGVPPTALGMHWALARGVHLPPEDADAIRSLAIKAAWINGWLATPLPTPRRKCPVLPWFMPIAQPDGLSFVPEPGRFHAPRAGGPPEKNQERCPFR